MCRAVLQCTQARGLCSTESVQGDGGEQEADRGWVAAGHTPNVSICICPSECNETVTFSFFPLGVFLLAF